MDWQRILIKRDRDTYKGDYGHVLIVGGSRGLTGAVCLSASACLKTGAGLVTAAVPKSLNHIFEIKLTEVMTLPLKDYRGVISSEGFKNISKFVTMRGVNVLGVGPGLSSLGDVKQLVHRIMNLKDKALVLDADALNVLDSEKSLKKNDGRFMVLTPHLGEFSRLTGLPVDKIKKNRKKLAKEFALRYNLILVLKSDKTIVTDGKDFFENSLGNAGMATAGSGDVLAGIICGLASQALKKAGVEADIMKVLFESAKIGVILHSLSGDIAAKSLPQACLTASDIIEYLPKAVLSLIKYRKS